MLSIQDANFAWTKGLTFCQLYVALFVSVRAYYFYLGSRARLTSVPVYYFR